MSAGRAFVCVLRIHLHFPEAQSLKAKRSELAPVLAWLRGKAGVSVVEVDHHDLWQRATLAAAMTSSSPAKLQEAVDRVQGWLDARFPAGARMDRAIISLDDLENLGDLR